ncbi:MAG: IS21 family transposase, partial [Thiotrichales bacterium]
MSNVRISMRKLKELMRLKYDAKLKHRQIAASLKISAATVSRCLDKINDSGLSWPTNLTETELEQKLYGKIEAPASCIKTVPDWQIVHKELKKKGVTKLLLWEEYCALEPDKKHYSYSQFCTNFRKWQNILDVSMRQTHIAGEKMFVDYAGPTIDIVNRDTGEINAAQIFIAVLGASNFSFVEATQSQQLPDWIGSHVRAFEFFGGVTEIIVPDNLKSEVSKACYYDPDINPTYQHLANYYNVAVIPARPYHPKDKAKAETGVLVTERWILAKLRNCRFFSLGE